MTVCVCEGRGDRNYKPNPRLARVLDILFILHAEHEMNCSTAAARHLASRYFESFLCISATEVLHMASCIQSIFQ